jgi:hypothetical protein
MNCAEANRHLEGALDGALTDETEKALRLHLGACPSCSAALAGLQALSYTLRVSPELAPSAALDERVMAAFNRAHRPQPHAPRAVSWWRGLIYGSIKVPKPVFAAALMVFALSLALAAYVGRLTSTQIAAAPQPPTFAEVFAPARPQVVYVPVGSGRDVTPPPTPPPAPTTGVRSKRALTARRPPRRAGSERIQAQRLESFMLVSAGGTNYTTNTKLRGFEPLPTATVRVLKGRGE